MAAELHRQETLHAKEISRMRDLQLERMTHDSVGGRCNHLNGAVDTVHIVNHVCCGFVSIKHVGSGRQVQASDVPQ